MLKMFAAALEKKENATSQATTPAKWNQRAEMVEALNTFRSWAPAGGAMAGDAMAKKLENQ